jgi:UDP-galactopyranose mutase
MWGRPANELSVSVGARLPVRTNRDDRYFTDGFQALPKGGYHALFANILNHPNIRIRLSNPYDIGMEGDFLHSFLSVPIDGYFAYQFGELPYRSILFHQTRSQQRQEAPVINYTDSGRFTRSTQWDLLPNSGRSTDGLHGQTREEPCSMERNPGEYYYPVQTEQSKKQLLAYQEQAKKPKGVTFIGRTGLFRYIDMLPAVTMHLELAAKFLKDQAPE